MKWTAGEIDILKNSWGVYSVKSIAKNLNRTEESIIKKAKRLSLGGAYQREYLSANSVSELLKVDIKTVLRWGNKYNLNLMNKRFRTRNMKMIALEDLTKWLKDNQNRWDSRRLELYALGLEPEWLKEKRKKDREIPKKRFAKWTITEDKKAIDLYKMGKPIKEIAEDLNRSYSAVSRRISRLDVWGTGEYIGG